MENSNGVNKKIIVHSALGVLILVFSFLFWATLTNALSDSPDWIVRSIWSLVFLMALGICAGLFFLVESDELFLYGMPAAIILPVLVFLKPGLATMLVLAGAIIFFILAAYRSHFEKTLRIKFISGIILRKGLAPMITGLALLVTLLFYFTPFTQSLGGNISVPRPLFDAIAGPAADLALNISLPSGADLKSVPEFEKQKAGALDKVYLSMNEELSTAGKSFKKWIPLGVSVSLFFAFKVIGTFLSWAMMLFTWLIFRALLWSGVVKINKVAAEREILEI